MAGGIYAAAVPCLKCAGRADRIYEGLEDDYYRCSACGYEFGIDWSYAGAPSAPAGPLPRQLGGEVGRHMSSAQRKDPMQSRPPMSV